MSKYKTKVENFCLAAQRLNEANLAFESEPDNELYRDALIQRFEFTFELGWKSMKEYLEDQGLSVTITFPKQVLKEAYRYQMIDDEQIWCDMLSSRNQTSHIYDEYTAQRIAKAISQDYVSVLLKLKEKIKIKNRPLCYQHRKRYIIFVRSRRWLLEYIAKTGKS